MSEENAVVNVEEKNSGCTFIDKQRLIDVLMGNSSNLNNLTIKISGKGEALEELVKVLQSGQLDYKAPEPDNKSLEDLASQKTEEASDDDSDIVRE